ncbi:hypothetical protein ALC62_13541 [Cyphomyrmex costatus]|uniref:Reverse transcriptase domain-containing protein n=1 Tax=Cyphomyrmex costatus TaxID=456900 RepID=A0A151IA96_9HYME|nr:hypothetical protein ALC62_13541 [Cyphomyrmex costatus]
MKPVLYTLRQQGFFSVVYLVDFRFIAGTYNLCLRNIFTTLDLLSSLGFIINMRKSVLTPIFYIESFAIAIPPDRRETLLQMTLEILNKKQCKIRYLANYIGLLIAVCPAVQYGLLHTKLLEREKFLALLVSDNIFEAQIPLQASLREDLWWKHIFTDSLQCNYIRSSLFAIEIYSDAFLSGWGAVCGERRTHGFFWSHINYLELLAAFHALRCFASHLRNSDILLRIFGRFDIDLFSTSINTKCSHFVSWHPDPFAVAVDVFSLNWSIYIYIYIYFPFTHYHHSS